MSGENVVQLRPASSGDGTTLADKLALVLSEIVEGTLFEVTDPKTGKLVELTLAHFKPELVAAAAELLEEAGY